MGLLFHSKSCGKTTTTATIGGVFCFWAETGVFLPLSCCVHFCDHRRDGYIIATMLLPSICHSSVLWFLWEKHLFHDFSGKSDRTPQESHSLLWGLKFFYSWFPPPPPKCCFRWWDLGLFPLDTGPTNCSSEELWRQNTSCEQSSVRPLCTEGTDTANFNVKPCKEKGLSFLSPTH